MWEKKELLLSWASFCCQFWCFLCSRSTWQCCHLTWWCHWTAVRSDTDTVAQTAELTISWRGGGRNQFSRRITAHFGSHQVDLCAAAGVGADLCMLVEVQFTRVHDLPVKLNPMRGFYTPSHTVYWAPCLMEQCHPVACLSTAPQPLRVSDAAPLLYWASC